MALIKNIHNFIFSAKNLKVKTIQKIIYNENRKMIHFLNISIQILSEFNSYFSIATSKYFTIPVPKINCYTL